MKAIQLVRIRQVIRLIICSMSSVLILAAAAAEKKAVSNPESKTQTSEKRENKTTMAESAQNAEAPKGVITGSHIPQKMRRNGTIADTTSPVYVIDRKAIDQTGASTVAQVLKRRVASTR